MPMQSCSTMYMPPFLNGPKNGLGAALGDCERKDMISYPAENCFISTCKELSFRAKEIEKISAHLRCKLVSFCSSSNHWRNSRPTPERRERSFTVNFLPSSPACTIHKSPRWQAKFYAEYYFYLNAKRKGLKRNGGFQTGPDWLDPKAVKLVWQMNWSIFTSM